MCAVQGAFQEAYLDREELKHTTGAPGYGSAKHFKHREMEDVFMNLVSDTEARDTYLTNMMTTNGNLSTQLTQQEYQILALQDELCNIKVASATQPVNVKTNKTGQPYVKDKKQKL